MAITTLNIDTLKSLLTGMWQRDLNTDKDPANGRWLTDGANSDGVGLYGGLTDAIDQVANLDLSGQIYVPTQVIADTHIVDNRNGLNSAANPCTLSGSWGNTTSSTHTVSNSVNIGLGFEFKAKAEIFGIGGEATTKFSINYTYTSTDATTTTQSNTQTSTQTIPVTVPAGKVYQASLVAEVHRIDVPYTLNVIVTGRTETWFSDRVNGHYNWMMDAGSAFGRFNNADYTQVPAGGRVVGVKGTLTQQQTANFTAIVVDITNTYQPAVTPAVRAAVNRTTVPVAHPLVARTINDLIPAGATLVSSTPIKVG